MHLASFLSHIGLVFFFFVKFVCKRNTWESLCIPIKMGKRNDVTSSFFWKGLAVISGSMGQKTVHTATIYRKPFGVSDDLSEFRNCSFAAISQKMASGK